MSVKKIYVTDKLSPKIIHDDQGYLCTFTDTKDNILRVNEGLEKNDSMPNVWFVVITDPEKIKRIEALKGFGSVIKEAKAEPIIGQTLNLKSQVGPAAINEAQIRQQATQQAQVQLNKEREQMKADSKRYGELFSKICKNGGGYVVNADPAEVQEFEQLKTKLGIEEKKENEE